MPLLSTLLALAAPPAPYPAPVALRAHGESATPLVLERIVDPALGGMLVQPVDVTAIPGDDRLLVVEMGGTVRWVGAGQVGQVPFLDVSAHITATGLAGLRAIALHPDYEANGEVYLWYDAPDGAQGLDLVLARILRSSADPNVCDPATRVELLRVPQDVRGHGGGGLKFGPDGYLWVGLGDGGLQHDPNCRAQDPGSLLGKILRLDVDGSFPYGIPPDNPFVGLAGHAPEVAHLGFRHPWKWSFDR
ncbi:MAG: PQQ-dependent sugar dehydrogenase, partial [Planctomycetota bacterium]